MPLSAARTIEAFNAAFNRKDLEELAALITDDCRFENTFPRPDGQAHSGKASVLASWASFFESSPSARFEVEEVVDAGDRCIVRWVYRWVDRGGAPGHVGGLDLFCVRDGKVAEKLSYVKG